ncbi:hypothetical protein [Methanocella conradii]|uniref:hypothetical protein n=1 Tax=Methanocella conradii TaxID=1175444 RepID=UPI00157E1289|nr:hypothetical protein [Methanocella conradii]
MSLEADLRELKYVREGLVCQGSFRIRGKDVPSKENFRITGAIENMVRATSRPVLVIRRELGSGK